MYFKPYISRDKLFTKKRDRQQGIQCDGCLKWNHRHVILVVNI